MIGNLITEPEELVRLFPGDKVTATRYGRVCFRGIVDEVSSRLGLVWIREPVLGERKLFCLPEHAFHRMDGPSGLPPRSDLNTELVHEDDVPSDFNTQAPITKIGTL